jgi:hypothetical protein
MRIIYNSYISGNTVLGKGGLIMFKNLFMTMSYSTFMKWQIAAMATGAAYVGMAWLGSKWKEAYKEAQDAGAVR